MRSAHGLIRSHRRASVRCTDAPGETEDGGITYQPIENYGIIGDLRTVALVGKDGSIDFLCVPRFDSPTIFAAILDDERGGRFSLAPLFTNAQQKQLYLPDSNILLTRFLADEGIGEISDFMAMGDGMDSQTLVRRAKTVHGEVRFRLVCAPRFDYGRARHHVEIAEEEARFIPDGGPGPALRLHSSIPIRVQNGDVVADFTLRAGETAAFVLEGWRRGQAVPAAAPTYVSDVFKDTLNFWRAWIGGSTYRGRWRETVNRSALALKLLISRPSGAPVAAATLGLPEWIGGVRNWDYRYTWIRDASLTMHALIRLGFVDEPRAFLGWIEDRCRDAGATGTLQILYGIDGGRPLEEEELPNLEGYRGSAPVRVGNAACVQTQLDIYGELVEAVYFYHRHRGEISDGLWSDLARLVDWVSDHWREKDESIWEVRGGPKHFLYSRLMCWVAVDRALRIATDRDDPRAGDRWRRTRTEIAREIHTEFWDPKRQAYVQHKGSTALGAAALRMPLVGFIRATDPRWRSTMRAIEEDLVDDAFVYRYRSDQAPDGLPGDEGTFCLCSFWYVECLSRAGELQKARLIFEKMLGYANHLGLYAEQLGHRGEHLGNFPQAFSHLALISAAIDLDRRLERQKRKSGRSPGG